MELTIAGTGAGSGSQPPFSIELADELLAIYGSPLYVYQGDRLRHTIQRMTQAFADASTRFHFASVTNGNIALLQQFRSAGWGLHANTPGDVYLGLQAGFAPAQIVYSGSNLNWTETEQLLDWGVCTFNWDSVAQLQQFCEIYTLRQPALPQIRVGLRLNLPELTGESRIGVRPAEFAAAIGIAQKAGLTVSGLHFYRGTGTNATSAFTQAIDTVLYTAQQLPDWRYLDFGGGFGYPYRAGRIAFDWQHFGATLTQRLQQLDRTIELIIEPGRAAIAGCAALLARVVAVKWQDQKQIVGVDTTVVNLAVPAVHGGYREIVTWVRPAATRYATDICGNTTYSRDYLGRNCQLPALELGDPIVVLDVGAYGYAMSSHFLHRPRPAEVLLDGGTHRLIRRRENYGVLLENQVF